MTRYAISQPVTQVEAPRLLSGKGKFTDDIKLPRQAVGVFLRSPYAHADIVSIDTSAAAALPGRPDEAPAVDELDELDELDEQE